MKSVGANMPPGVPLTKESAGGKDFERRQQRQHSPGELVVHRLVDEVVAGAHHLRKPDADHANQQPCHGGLKVLRPARQGLQARPRVGNNFTKTSEESPPMTPSAA